MGIELKPDERLAYFILESVKDKEGNYIPCIAVEGRKGYYLTDWAWGKNIDIAEKAALEKNTEMGLTQADVDKIIFGTMKTGKLKLERSNEIDMER